MHTKILSIGLIIILFTSSACNLAGRAGPQAAPTPFPTLPPPPPPSGFVGLLQQKVAAGEWTEEQGLVTLLKLFAGEVKDDALGADSQTRDGEGTGVFLLAQEYLKNGSDAATKTEITRLLKLIVPTRAMLKPYSKRAPAPTPTSAQTDQISYQRQAPEDCSALWRGGFPDTRTPSFQCFQYDEETISGQTYRVYYPYAWLTDTNRLAYYNATLDAIRTTVPLYRSFGTMRSIYFIFTTLTDARAPDALAATYNFAFNPAEEACPVLIYPTATDPFEVSLDEFKQSMAHEMFHCFQAWNLHDQALNVSYYANKWWQEGTAEYFSNLAYPTVNYEDGFMLDFDQRSLTQPLPSMDYENFLFFQFMGNQITPQGVLRLLQSMPTSGDYSDQLAALSAFPHIADLFEKFTRDFIDGTIEDSGGGFKPSSVYRNGFISIDAPREIQMVAKPFVITRWVLLFPKEKRFSLTKTASDPADMDAAELQATTGHWDPLPEDFVSGCGEKAFTNYEINTGSELTFHTLTVKVNDITKAPCDRCLVGDWQYQADSLTSFFQAIFASSSNVTFNGVQGGFNLHFAADEHGSGEYDGFKASYTEDIPGTTGKNNIIQVTVNFDGAGSGDYSAADGLLSWWNGSYDFNTKVDMVMNGKTLPSVPAVLSSIDVAEALMSGSEQYVCTRSTLQLMPPLHGKTMPAILFKRVSP